MRVLAFLLLLLAPDAGDRWWNHVRQLADDRYEGREAGSQGYRSAAEYVAQEYERAGLKPAAGSGYLQPVRFEARRVIEEHSSVALVRAGNAQPVKLGDEAILGTRIEGSGEVEADAVFAGYGLRVPEAGYDDFAGLDVRGKIVVYYSASPDNIGGYLRAHYSSRFERQKVLRDVGALGTAGIVRPDSDVPWPRAALRRFQASLDLEGGEPGGRLAISINPEHAGKWLAGSGHTFAEILELHKAGKPLPRFPLAVRVRANTVLKKWHTESQNVLGLLPGTDPRLRNQYVVLSAHLDGLGVGSPIGGDKVYNGAMDNAAGIATLLEIARELKAPKRSILFASVTAEEKGLLGSQYLSKNLPVPAGSVVANINMDMYLPLTPLKSLEVQGVNESTLGEQVRTLGKESGIDILDDREPERNLFIRSDQYNFVRLGVPALAFKFGYEKGSAEEKVYKAWLKERYHAPSDDLDQPVDRAAAARFNGFILKLAERVANAPERPRWVEKSFFKRFAR
jgi:hypothetical protein